MKKKSFDKVVGKIVKKIRKGKDLPRVVDEINRLLLSEATSLTPSGFEELYKLRDEARLPSLSKKDPWFTFVMDTTNDDVAVLVHVQGKDLSDAGVRVEGVMLDEYGLTEDEFGPVIAVFEGKLKDVSDKLS